jgi:hypothetical protein
MVMKMPAEEEELDQISDMEAVEGGDGKVRVSAMAQKRSLDDARVEEENS